MPAAIEARGLVKTFGDLRAVDGLSFAVEEGEVWSLLGPNGAGKTTAIRIIAGLTRPTEGEVLIKGTRAGAGAGAGHTLVGLCPQEIVIWEHLTVRENLRFIADLQDVPKREAGKRADDLMERLRLGEKQDQLAVSLSGGMKRRLNLALALIHDPPLVVLDEPSAGLDPQSRIVVHDFISELGKAEGKAVILTTHEMDVADRLSNRVAIIDHGKLKVEGTPEKLKNTVGEGDTVVIRLREAARAEEAAKIAAGVPGVKGALAVSREIRFNALNAVTLLKEVYSELERNSIAVEDASMRKNTLEDVFIAITGRALREEGQP